MLYGDKVAAKWLEEYNTERPHLGIDLKTPIEVILGANMS